MLWIKKLTCRLFGINCTVERPSSKDLINEMKHEGRKADARAFDLRRQREDLARTIGGYNGG